MTATQTTQTCDFPEMCADRGTSDDTCPCCAHPMCGSDHCHRCGCEAWESFCEMQTAAIVQAGLITDGQVAEFDPFAEITDEEQERFDLAEAMNDTTTIPVIR